MLNVYFVDDDELIIEELKSIIDWNKHNFEICGYSTDPVIAMKDIIALEPTLVICDVQMDILNGLKLAEQVTNINKKINFCFLSAYDKFDYAIEAIRIGAIRYLKKPIKIDELVHLLFEIREKEIEKLTHQLSAILANSNPYQDDELRKLFEQSHLFKSGMTFRIVVLFGDVDDIDISKVGMSRIVLYKDNKMVISLVYDVDLEKLNKITLEKNISIGISSESNNYNNMSYLLKTARIASKNKFITGKHELVEFKENPNVELLINAIKSANYSYDLKKIILNLKKSIIELGITTNYIQMIYQVIIYSLIKFKLIEYDVDIINVSVLHFYHSIDQMIEDLLMNFEEFMEQDLNVILLNEIKADLKKNLSNKISLSEYAGKYGYNTSYFSQWFKKICGMSFVEYVITERIEIAKHLIMNSTHLSLRSVALEVGYDDYYHFSKIFKKYTGLSPIDFQNKVQK